MLLKYPEHFLLPVSYHDLSFCDHSIKFQRVLFQQTDVRVESFFDPSFSIQLQDGRRVGCDAFDRGFKRNAFLLHALPHFFQQAGRLPDADALELARGVQDWEASRPVGSEGDAVA